MASERRDAGRRRRLGDHMFQAMFMAMDEGAVARNGNGEIAAVNPAAENILGLTAAEWIGRSSTDFARALGLIGEDETPLPWERHPATLAMQTGKPQRNVLMGAHRPDGTLVWISCNAQPLPSHDESGPDGVVTTFRDVSERKASERQLRQALEFTQGVINAIPDLLFEADRDGICLNVWARTPGLLAMHKEALLGKRVSDVVAPDTAEVALAAFREADEKELSFGKVLRVDIPQGERWFELSVSKRPGSEVPGRFIVLARNVTERKRMEDDIRRRELEFRSLAENIPDGLVRYDRQARAQYMNPAILADIAPEGRPVLGESLLETFAGNDAQTNLHRLIERVIATGTPVEVEFQPPKFHGEIRTRQVRYVAERDANGEIVGALGIGRDITERKASERQLRQALEFTQGVINAIPDLLFEVDRVGTYLNVWARTPELLAAEKEVLLGKTVSDVMAPDAAEVALSAIREADDKGMSFGRVLRLDLPRGESWFELSVSKKPGGDVPSRFIVLSRDVTERKRMEDDIRRRELEFRSLAENIPDNVVRYDRQGRVLYFNPALRTSLAPELMPVLGLSAAEASRGRESLMTYHRAVERVIATGTPSEFEFQLPNPDGETRDHRVHIVAERDGNGEIVGALSIGRDVTERKRMEQAVAAREQEFRSLAESSRDRIIRYDRDGRVRYLNAQLLAFFGKSATDIIGRLPREVWPDGCYAGIERASAHAVETGEATTVEFDIADATGALRSNQVVVVPERDSAGQIIGSLAFGRDITALRETERQLRHFIENLPGMAYTFRLSPDGHTHIPYVSPAIKELFGVEPDDVKEDTAPLCELAHPEDRPRIEAATAESARTMKPYRVEYRIRRPDQPERWVDQRCVPEREVDGSIVWYGILLDITERKLADEYEHFRSRTLELLSAGAPLSVILEAIVHGVEQLQPDIICSIRLLDKQGKKLGEGVAPSLPDFYNAAVDGLEIGVGAGCCGTVAATGERVIAEDIMTHPYWVNYKALAAKAGLAACWSEPIRASSGKVLGTFAVYHRQAHSPAAFDIALIEKSTHLVSIAIERRRAEEALRTSELEFRSLAENMPDNVVRYDGQARAQYFNPAIKASVAPGFLPVLGESPTETYLGNDAAASYQQAIEQVIATGTPVELEFQAHDSCGEMRDHLVRFVAERDDNGKIVGALAIGRDITEHKRAEEYERFRSQTLDLLSRGAPLPDILESIVRGVEQLDRDRICSILLLHGDGRHFCKGIAPSLPDSYNAALDGLEIGVGVGCCGTAAATGQRVIADDLTTHPYWAPYQELVATAGLGACWSEPIRASSGKVLGTFAVYHRHAHSPTPFDIDLIEKSTHLVSIAIERRRAEEALRASELEFRTLAENLPDFLVRYDREGRRAYVNPVMERVFAASADQMLGSSLRQNNPAKLPMPETYVRALEHTLATGERSEFEMAFCPAGGKPRTGLCFIVAERGSDGQVSGAIAVTRDITELKRNEAELDRHRHHLEKLVDERTLALSAAKEAAEVANRAKSHFLAAASHDLRQPLQAIRLFNDALAMSGLNERQKKIGNALSKSVSSLNELLNDLLDLSRLDAGTIEPQPVAIQAEDLLEAIGLDFDAVCQEKALRLKLACPQRSLVLFSDENLLLTLLRNLVSNAVKYTKRGGILVGIRRRRDCALIQVWDTGIGIPAELRDSIFEEYFQIGNPERDRAKGVGLGLAIVRRLSKLLGVAVRLYSREGKGSVFEVSVPLAHGSALPVSPPPAGATLETEAPSRLAGKRIVAIDDDGTAGEAVKLALEMEGARVILFDTPESALASAEVMGADYYVSDYRLPGMNGLQLLDAIQENSAEPIKAVLLTGNVSPDQIASLRSCRWKVVLKPIALAELLSALDARQAVP